MISKTENRKCDRCGATSQTIDNEGDKLALHTVGVSIERSGYGRSCIMGQKAEWCEDCCIKTGLLKPPKPKVREGEPEPPKAPEPLSIEEMLRELAREEAEQVVDYRG